MTTNRDEALRLAKEAGFDMSPEGYGFLASRFADLITLAREPLEARVRELQEEVEKYRPCHPCTVPGCWKQDFYNKTNRLATAEKLLREARHHIAWGDSDNPALVANITAFLSEQQPKVEA